VWATVAMAAGGSGSSGARTPAASSAAPPMFAASSGSTTRGDCPNMGGTGGNSTTPSTQSGSANPGL
ncbi:MAG: hypothetical protein ACJ77E_00110, partial [Gaiellaceae bacterium]